MDLTTFNGVVTGLNSAATLTKSLIGIKDETAIRGKVIELQSIILDVQSNALAAQSEQAALKDKIKDLQNELITIRSWVELAEKYELKEIDSGVFVYQLKADFRVSEPNHFLCPNCFQNQQKAILQDTRRTAYDRRINICPSCKNEYSFGRAP